MIQYLDSQGNLLLTAGEEKSNIPTVWTEFELQKGERVIGIQANADFFGSAWIYDIQFVIGKLVDESEKDNYVKKVEEI